MDRKTMDARISFSSKTVLVLCVALVVSTLAGCSSAPADDPERQDAAPAPVSTEGFTGPYAAEFAYNTSIAPNDAIREMLSDSNITEAEAHEVLSDFKRCVSDFGYEITNYAFDGSYGVDFPPNVSTDVVNRRVNNCSISTGEAQVLSLYSWTNRNPERLDEAAIVIDCLIDSGVVPKGYSPADFEENMRDGKFPLIGDTEEAREKLSECQIDPLGHSR